MLTGEQLHCRQGYLDFLYCPFRNQILAWISYSKISMQGYLNLLWKKGSGWGNSHLVVETTAIRLRNSNIKFLLLRSESSDPEDSKFHPIQIFTANPPNIHWEECSSKKAGFKTLLIIHSSISMLQFYTNTAGISASKAKLLLLIYAMTNLRNTQSQIMIMNLSCAASSLR